MLFTDANNTTYRVDSQFFTPGDAYSCAQGQVVKLDKSTGHLTPIATGVGNPSALHDPHGMLFIAFLSIRSAITCRKPTVTTSRRQVACNGHPFLLPAAPTLELCKIPLTNSNRRHL